MKHLTLLTILMLLGAKALSQSRPNASNPYIETTAIVDSLVVPDRIYLSINISEKDTRGRTSVEMLENTMNLKLKSIGIDIEKQLSLSDVTSNFKKYFLKDKDVLKKKVYELVVYDAETAGQVILGLESIDISNVYLTRTEYSNLENLKLTLKEKAVIKAKRQAETMLNPLNQNIGKAIYVSDLNTEVLNNLNFNPNNNFIRGYASQEVIITGFGISRNNIEFKKIKVESGVNMSFTIN